MSKASLLSRAARFLYDLSPRKAVAFLRDPSTLPPRSRGPGYDDVLAAARAACPPDVDEERLRTLHQGLLRDHAFYQEINERYIDVRGRRLREPAEWLEVIYLLLRVRRPGLVLETGVFDGLSDCFILKALEENGHGSLIALDLPASEAIPGSTHRMAFDRLPPGQGPGWLVPERLRPRRRLLLGDSRELLPQVLAEVEAVDVFLHDSMHTYDHMTYEYTTVWPRLREGGLLLSDDISWNRAFSDFAAKHGGGHLNFRYKLGLMAKGSDGR